MRKLFFLACFCALSIGGAYFAGTYYRQLQQANRCVRLESDNGFRFSECALEQKPFVISIYGYNNGAYLERVLKSVFSQVYDCYRIVYIDDASTDGSFDLAQECIKTSGQMMRTTLVRNEERLGLSANLKRVAQFCQDHEIIVVLGNEEWLAHEWVLSRFNGYFSNLDLWMCYAQTREFPSYRPLVDETVALRSQPMQFGIKAFYASLFHKIFEEDLCYGSILDLAFMFPLLEMSHNHSQFVSDTLSVISGREKETDTISERQVRALKPYAPLDSLQTAPLEDL